MISIKNGFEIACVKQGKKVINNVYVKDYDEKNEEKLDKKDIESILPKSYWTKLRNITPANVIILKRALRTENTTLLKDNMTMHEAYKEALIIINDVQNKLLECKKDEHIQVLPFDTHFSIGVFGPSGVGKSYWIGQFLLEFRKKFKDRPIYIFSPIRDDPAFQKSKPIYIRIDETLLQDPLKCFEFQKGLCVFDDIESLSKEYYSLISHFRDACLEVGRHDGIDIISVHHVIQGGNSTKKIINESDLMVCFPRSNFSAIERICKNYYGFGKDDIAYLKMIGKKSRWCCVKRSYPSVIMSEHEIKIV